MTRCLSLCSGLFIAATTYCFAVASQNAGGARDVDDSISLRLYTSVNALVAAHSPNSVVGMVVGLATEDVDLSTVPENWLYCDGSEVAATSFPELAALLGDGGRVVTQPGNVRLPDYRGLTAMLDAKLAGLKNFSVHQLHLVGACKGRNAHVRWVIKAK